MKITKSQTTYSIIFSLLFISACASNMQQRSKMKNTISRQIEDSDAVYINLTDSCSVLMQKLINSSNMFDPSDRYNKFWGEQWKKNGYYSLRLNSEGNAIIELNLHETKPGTGPITIGYYKIDTTKNELKPIDLNNTTFPALKIDTIVFKNIIHNCISWKK